MEPDPKCFESLKLRFGNDERVQLSSDAIPGGEALRSSDGGDLVMCQTVLEHIGDDRAAFLKIPQFGRDADFSYSFPRILGSMDLWT